ncbi:triple tyrosine motif-containing protein [Ekhidna sp.]|uniref:helix-turn-helix and ligand-binding sensor domain-containing protein n=1 Tax=Ekhidna sp. TaxID=2608089 RepID=UPI003299AB2F
MKNILLFMIFSTNWVFSQTTLVKKNDLISIPLITTFTPSEYNGGIQNWGIAQDTTGYIYVANNYGLLEFDGATWNSYPIDGATKTRSVLVDETSNRIYVGGQRQLGYFDRTSKGLSYQSLLDRIPSGITVDEIWDLITFQGNIYANINGSIVSIKNDRITSIKNVDGVEFLMQANNELIAGSTNGIYIKKNGEGFKKVHKSQKSFRGAIKQDGNYLMFTYDGEIYHYNQGNLKRYYTQIDNFLADAKINKVLKLSNDHVVIATQNNGLIILDKDLNPIQHLTKNKGLNHRTVLSLYEDDFKNLWVGLNNGISVIELGSPFSLINENVGLEGTGYVASVHNNTIYLGTSSGLFKPYEDRDFRSIRGYSLINGSEGLVNNLSIIDGKIILSHHEGAFKLNSSGTDQFFDATGTWQFKAIGNSKWLGGTYDGFYLINQIGNTQSTKYLKGLAESSRVFEFENDTTLWMTHGYKGAFKITLKGDSIHDVKRYGANSGFPSDILISVYQIGNELIFTGELGVYLYNAESDSFDRHPFLNEWFGDRHVSKIKEASNGNIYFIANGEMGVLKRKTIGVYEIEEKQFRKINGFISDDLENISLLNSESILIGAKEGFVLYKPDWDQPIKEIFHAHLKNVSVTNHDDSTSHISGTFFKSQALEKTKRLRFEYSSPYFDGLNDIKYAYRLMPYENEWSEWSTTNWEEYTNLPAKDYTFEVKAMNVYGNESVVSRYNFTINPEWYETNLAYAAYASLILFIFTSVLLVRERKHKVEKRFINLTKEEVIRSKEREISEFSEKTNQEIQSLKNQSLKKEIEHKNSQLASVTMHLLSKNEFVMSLRKKINDALENKDNTETLNKIVKSIDRNIDEDEAWETFAHHFDQVHGNFLHKIKQEVHLTPQETKLCAYLKMNMSTKDIANLMNITIRGVELGRYRLRKKLGIQRETNLVEYLDNF